MDRIWDTPVIRWPVRQSRFGGPSLRRHRSGFSRDRQPDRRCRFGEDLWASRCGPLPILLVVRDEARSRRTGRAIIENGSVTGSKRAERRCWPSTKVIRYGGHNVGRWWCPMKREIAGGLHRGRGHEREERWDAGQRAEPASFILHGCGQSTICCTEKTRLIQRAERSGTDRWCSGCSGPKPGMRDGLAQRNHSRVRWFKTVPSRKFGVHSFSCRKT